MSGAQKRKIMLLAGLVFLCALFVIVVFYSSVYRYVHKMKPGQIEQNVYVQGVDVSGLTKGEAQKKIERHWENVKDTTLIVKDGEKEARISVEELGIEQVQTGELLQKAADYAKKGNLFSRYRKIREAKKEKIEYAKDYELDEEKAEEILKEKTAGFYEEARDAGITRVGGVFQIAEEQSGESLDMKDAVKSLKECLPKLTGGKTVTMEVKAKKDKPDIKKKDLQMIEDKLGTFSIKIKDTKEQEELMLQAGMVNGTVLMPEKEFSFKRVLKEYIESNVKEEVYPATMGQMASVLYNAALRAELEITERKASDEKTAYVEPGMDAGIGEKKNLKFKNNLETPVYIETYIDKEENLVCTIYGKENREEDRKISFESEILEEEKPETEYIADEDLNAGELKDAGEGTPKIKAKLWKIVKEGKKNSSRKLINETVYPGENHKIYVGTKSDDEEIVEKLEKAVQDQDQKAIEEVVEEVKEKQ